nr:hypothetical protein [Nitrosomonas nitrosa]
MDRRSTCGGPDLQRTIDESFSRPQSASRSGDLPMHLPPQATVLVPHDREHPGGERRDRAQSSDATIDEEKCFLSRFTEVSNLRKRFKRPCKADHSVVNPVGPSTGFAQPHREHRP